MKIKIGLARHDHSACNWAVTRVGASLQCAGESNLRSNSWRCVRVDSAATTIRTTRETMLATVEKSANFSRAAEKYATTSSTQAAASVGLACTPCVRPRL